MTSNEPPPPTRCVVCGDLENDHQRIHPFSASGVRLPLGFFAGRNTSSPRASDLPVDLVLRQALLDKGMITPDDVAKAATRVQAIIGNDSGGVGDGDDSGPEQG